MCVNLAFSHRSVDPLLVCFAFKNLSTVISIYMKLSFFNQSQDPSSFKNTITFKIKRKA